MSFLVRDIKLQLLLIAMLMEICTLFINDSMHSICTEWCVNNKGLIIPCAMVTGR